VLSVDSVRWGLRTHVRMLLTPPQGGVHHPAVVEGYFEVPRRISRTELAIRMGAAGSMVPVTLAAIGEKIVEPIATGKTVR
jgi:predicted DNA binding protein